MAVLKQSLSQEIHNGLGDSLRSPALYSEALQELEETYEHYFTAISSLKNGGYEQDLLSPGLLETVFPSFQPASTHSKLGPKQGWQATDGHSKYPAFINRLTN
jgi:hypothetical protein